MPPPPLRPPRPGPGRPDRRTPRQRAKAVKDALAARGPGRFTVHTPDGSVTIEEARVVTDPDGADVVEILTADPENGDPSFRVINPPRYVPDPNGSVEIEVGGQVHRFRDDPIAALAHVIAQHGGRLKDPRRGR